MRGSATPADKVREFRAAYIELGTVAAAARKVGIPATTGWGLADDAEAEPEFVETRRRINARALAVVEDLVIESAQVAAERIAVPDRTPEELADIAVSRGLKSFSYQNPKPQYLKGLVDAHKSIAARTRIDAEKSGEISGAALVIVTSEPPAADGAAG